MLLSIIPKYLEIYDEQFVWFCGRIFAYPQPQGLIILSETYCTQVGVS